VTLDIHAFNGLPVSPARDLLRSCCGASRWIDGMLARRPFFNVASVLRAADDVWMSLGPNDWREAFAHHPRIGERTAAAAQSQTAAAWSAAEQSAMSSADAGTRVELAAANAAYEARFGHIYIVCAAGKSTEELLAIARQRLTNEPRQELEIAAAEQHKITRLRLRRLFNDHS